MQRPCTSSRPSINNKMQRTEVEVFCIAGRSIECRERMPSSSVSIAEHWTLVNCSTHDTTRRQKAFEEKTPNKMDVNKKEQPNQQHSDGVAMECVSWNWRKTITTTIFLFAESNMTTCPLYIWYIFIQLPSLWLLFSGMHDLSGLQMDTNRLDMSNRAIERRTAHGRRIFFSSFLWIYEDDERITTHTIALARL